MNIDLLNEVSTEVAKYSDYNEKLNKWAELTVEYCHNLNMEKKIDRAFFAFQSMPQYNPEVLILGLNPRGKDSYKAQYSNEKWGLKEAGRMTPEVFVQQNQWYYGGRYCQEEKKEWNILKNLKKTVAVHPDLQVLFTVDKIVYMNILYFNSDDYKEFIASTGKHWKEIYDTCVQLSKYLIFEIIQPKQILCLGIDKCFKSFTSGSKSEVLIAGDLQKTEINNIPVYGMTHPSAWKITDDRRKTIGLALYSDWFSKPLMASMGETITKILRILKQIADSKDLLLHIDRDKLSARFGAFKFQSRNTKALCFEFQNSFYSDLRYGLFQNKWLETAKKSDSPYNNWINLFESFNEPDFQDYFERIVERYKDELSR
ncbi:hypothetical protein SAMN05421813_12424 [Daejeonella rubra]|uniref:Uracil DNA glycosylase superfamily protein n=1 Tax=Daejeonella rubra TaxID=990371 RepID=A0A1G9WA28_9SPHI|nr:hypothetical protein [Daejeonella rubra]SDM81081.1 hypothetical protein SAMN05421813_12424 [Daejeonella rubra]